MKLYQLTIWLLRVFSYLYFVEIRALNPERIPESGPVILAANHPTSVLDAILLATQTHRQIHFLAKSGLLKNRMITAYCIGWGPFLSIVPVKWKPTIRKTWMSSRRSTGCLNAAAAWGFSPRGKTRRLVKS